MPISRNDPCPCGSGRKYKLCHGRLDAQREPTAGEMQAVEIVRSVGTEEPEWEADAIPLMVSFAEDDAVRPVLLLVTAGAVALHHDVRPRLGGEPEQVATAIDRAVAEAARSAGVFPQTGPMATRLESSGSPVANPACRCGV